MKKYIGGFLELEIFPCFTTNYHAGALALSNARACISHVISKTKMQHVWLPYYTCNALIEPFIQSNISYEFYGLTDELSMKGVPSKLGKGDYLVYINYFGLKNQYVQELVGLYGDQLLVDNTQDFFSHGYANGWSFNSARKSFGVPDGGFLYGPVNLLGEEKDYHINTEYEASYLLDRLRGMQEKAYAGFMAYEQTLTSRLLRISELSASLLSQVDYLAVAQRRRENFQYCHNRLGRYNQLSIQMSLIDMPIDTIPFCYPFMPEGGERINRQMLYDKNVFISLLWSDVLTRQGTGFAWECHLTKSLFPLPVDHRYGKEEMAFTTDAMMDILER